MQYLIIDFKEFLRDKYRFNSILVFINRLEKSLVTILYYKTTNACQMA